MDELHDINALCVDDVEFTVYGVRHEDIGFAYAQLILEIAVEQVGWGGLFEEE